MRHLLAQPGSRHSLRPDFDYQLPIGLIRAVQRWLTRFARFPYLGVAVGGYAFKLIEAFTL